MAFSVAPLLKRQSPSQAFGHGWIAIKDGRRWHPANSQTELLAGLTSNRKKATWLTKLKALLFK